MRKIIESRVLGSNGFFYASKKGIESNRNILVKLCVEYSISYTAAKNIIKAERRRLTKEEMLEILSIKGFIWKEI